MNLFPLSKDLDKTAKYHVDKHVSKMITEAAQVISTVAWQHKKSKSNWTFYKPTHQNHPITKWVAQDKHNWEWVIRYMYSLQKEWQYRYDHTRSHASIEAIKALRCPNLPENSLLDFYQAMPNEFRCDDSIKAYRRFYALGKFHLWQWTNRTRPKWIEKYLRSTLLELKNLDLDNSENAFGYWIKKCPEDDQIKDLFNLLKELDNEDRSRVSKSKALIRTKSR
ncbi:MAG: hypothetical protein KGH75_04895 [Rhodospirillales bacterium]|nr:hypothetical protein [Rhodospirillales bacterium]